MPWLPGGGGGGDGVPQATKLVLGDAAQTIGVGGGSDLVSGVTVVGAAQRISLVAANSAPLGVPRTRPDLGAAWLFQGVDVDGTDMAGLLNDYEIMFGMRITAVGGGVLPEDVWGGIFVMDDSDPATAVITNSGDHSVGIGMLGVVQSAEDRAFIYSLCTRSTWQRGGPSVSPTGDPAIRIAWGHPRPATNANGQRSFLGSIVYGAADFGDAIIRGGSFDVETNIPTVPDFATIVACVGTDAALGADVDIDAEFYYTATPWDSAAGGLQTRGFV